MFPPIQRETLNNNNRFTKWETEIMLDRSRTPKFVSFLFPRLKSIWCQCGSEVGFWNKLSRREPQRDNFDRRGKKTKAAKGAKWRFFFGVSSSQQVAVWRTDFTPKCTRHLNKQNFKQMISLVSVRPLPVDSRRGADAGEERNSGGYPGPGNPAAADGKPPRHPHPLRPRRREFFRTAIYILQDQAEQTTPC